VQGLAYKLGAGLGATLGANLRACGIYHLSQVTFTHAERMLKASLKASLEDLLGKVSGRKWTRLFLILWEGSMVLSI